MNNEYSTIQRYGKLMIFLVLVLVLGMGIYQFSDYRQAKTQEQASILYEKMLKSFRQNEAVEGASHATMLIEQHRNTPYAILAAFMLSRMALEQNNEEGAIEKLKLAVSLAEKTQLEDIAGIRLARVLASQERYTEALESLPKENKESAYGVLANEIRGDIYVKQGNLSKAKESYEKAIKAANSSLPLTSLHLKYSDININDINIKEET